MVRLVPILLFARQVHILVNESGGRLAFSFFESSFLERFGVPCRPANYGHPNSTSLLQAIPQVVTMRGKGPRRVLMVNREIGGKLLRRIVWPISSCLNDELKGRVRARLGALQLRKVLSWVLDDSFVLYRCCRFLDGHWKNWPRAKLTCNVHDSYTFSCLRAY